MKNRLFIWFLTLVMVLGLLPTTAWAEETECITAYVTIADAGKLEVSYEAVSVTDQNGSGTFDIDDVLYAAHESHYEGGAESGYSSYEGDYGLAIDTLWGDSSGCFGYYVEDASANSLRDVVENGDKVVAFVYQDKTGWSDNYTYFDKSDVSVNLGEDTKVALTLSYQYYSETWETLHAGLENAVITVNGEPMEGAVTDEEGKVTISFEENGTYIVSAEKEDMNIVPPVCIVTVTEEQSPDSGTDNEGSGSDEEDGESDSDDEEDKVPAEMATLMENIAASYAENSGEWVIMDMAAYEDLDFSSSKTSDEAKQTYIKKAIESINKENVGDTTYDKAILSLTAIAIDAEELYPEGSETPISAIEGLNNANKSSSVWNVPYTLMAYGQKDYEGEETYVKPLLEAVLESQKEDGSWSSGWDNGIQATANMIAALSFYTDDEGVADAIEEAVGFLAEKQNEDGKFYDYAYADGNTAALTVIGLCAAGVNPDTDERFVKDGVSALDALLSFALEDESGFGWKDNTELNAGTTEQAFRALIAAAQVMETGEAFNIYDFSHNANSLQPGYAVVPEEAPVIPEEPVEPDTPKDDDDEITVEVSIKAIDEYWMRNKDVTIDEDATVYDAFMEAIDDSDIEQEGAEDGYIESMTKDGETLGEFDEGENSGWLYKVNDYLPEVGMKQYKLDDGDEILFYYTEDWTEDEDAGSHDKDKDDEEEQEIAEEEEPAETVEEEEIEENIPVEILFTDVTEESYYHDAVQWAVNEKITSGVTENEFGSEWTCSRGQLVTFIWRMMGSPEPETKRVPFIDVAEEFYYHDAILWALENNIAKGTGPIEFKPEQEVTRAQAVTFLWRALGMPEAEGEISFCDVPETEYYYKAVLWAAENGITSGMTEDWFGSNELCQRGQIVTFLYRSFGK